MDNLESKFSKKDVGNEYIIETDKSISYLGVTLDKAEVSDSMYVPDRAIYNDYINDTELSLPLQRDIAVSLLTGDPMLIEGGTSLGKTTTIMKMSSELGYEVYYINLNGAVDVDGLMGRYVPNANKKSIEDPEYIFADGKVTSGLRQEEGKIKVIILDEFNACSPNILIRLHEVIDALERGGDVILSEDASEAIKVDKSKTKIFAAMNPPGKGYMDRSPLDPAQLRRWVYKKLPSDLPDDTFSNCIDGLFGFDQKNVNTLGRTDYLLSRKEELLPEQLAEIQGIATILEKYKEFHKAAKELVKSRRIAEDQPQLFTFDDRMEPRRIRDFILKFYNGDINETFQNALRYYYSNKLENTEDKECLEEIIRQTKCEILQSNSKRKSLDEELDYEIEAQYVDGQYLIEKISNFIDSNIPEYRNALDNCYWEEHKLHSCVSVTLPSGCVDELPDELFVSSDKIYPMNPSTVFGFCKSDLMKYLKNKKVLASRDDGGILLRIIESGDKYTSNMTGDENSAIESSNLIAAESDQSQSEYDKRFSEIKKTIIEFYELAKATNVGWAKEDLNTIVWKRYGNGIILKMANTKGLNLPVFDDSSFVFEEYMGEFMGINSFAQAYAESVANNLQIYTCYNYPFIKLVEDLPF